MIKTNFHTHTIYCDGADTPEALVISAIEKGFRAIGFSGHSYFEIDNSCSMNPESEEKYFNDILSLKSKYKDKIEILCGIEQDLYSTPSTYQYDYKIGSVHYVYKNGEYLVADGSVAELDDILNRHYGKEFDLLAKDYFSAVCDVVEKTDADIIGHFDLILKNQDRINYTPTSRFYSYAEEAVYKLLKSNKPFEINTGAMARGYRKTPYPDYKILSFICENGGDIIFSSDCHSKEYLDFGFEYAKKMAKEAGFVRQAVITKGGIEYIDIE